MECLNQRLKSLRERAGLRQEDVAIAAGLSRAGYQMIESGKNGKTMGKLPAIAKALGCRIDDLFPEMDGYWPGSVNGDEGLDDLDL